MAAKDILITSKTKRFSFKSGCAICVENGKMRRQLNLKKANYKVRLYYPFIKQQRTF